MTTAFPGAIDALPRPSPSSPRDVAPYKASVVIDNISDAIEAIEAKLGIGASTPADQYEIRGSGAGASTWRLTPACSAYHDAAQSIATSTTTVLALNSERFDTDTIHDLATNNSRLTCKTAGTYLVVAQIQWAANATNRRVLNIRLNGTDNIGQDNRVADSAFATSVSISKVAQLAVNDYVEVTVYQDSGVAVNIQASNSTTARVGAELAMVRVG